MQSYSRLIMKIYCFHILYVITDITSELKNCTFAEIAPRTFYPLYVLYVLHRDIMCGTVANRFNSRENKPIFMYLFYDDIKICA